MKEEIHCWDINIYVKINESLRSEIVNKIKDKYNSFNNFENKTCFDRKTVSSICNGFFTNVRKLLKLIDLVGIKKEYVEARITHFRDSKTGAYNRTYENIFPLKLNPSIIRVASHLIGDGTVGKDYLGYGQVNHIKFMEKLINFVVTPCGRLNIRSRKLRSKKYFKEIKIPMVFAKIVCHCFSINKKHQ